MSLAAPFPYFGGKRRAAPIIWRALGDPGGAPKAAQAAFEAARQAPRAETEETTHA